MAGLRVVALGTGTALPDPLRAGSATAIVSGERVWLVDIGPGALLRLATAGISIDQVQGVILTHRHPDHCGDLPALLFARRAARLDHPFAIWGGPGLVAWHRALAEAWSPWLHPHGAPSALYEVTQGRTATPFGDLEVWPAAHSGGALHLRVRFEAGPILAWSGDTGPSANLEEAARNADLFLCECGAAPGEGSKKHLDPEGVRAVVGRAQPQRVWLTHLAAQNREEPWAAPYKLAADLDEIQL